MSEITFIDELIKNASKKEQQEFIQAQYKTILDLTKKNKKLEEEVEHLKTVLSNATKLELNEKNPVILDLNEADEVSIAKLELRKLKEASFDRHLTLEETKKVEIYSKILTQRAANSMKDIPGEAKVLTDKELLKLASDLKL